MRKGRKQTRCKVCKKRVYLKYNIDKKRKLFSCMCPNCGSHGCWKDRLITKK